MTGPGDDLTGVQREILDAFGLHPWQVGLGPVPWRVRLRAPFVRAWFRLRHAGVPAAGVPDTPGCPWCLGVLRTPCICQGDCGSRPGDGQPYCPKAPSYAEYLHMFGLCQGGCGDAQGGEG